MFETNKRWKARLDRLYKGRPYKSKADLIRDASKLKLSSVFTEIVYDYLIDYCPFLEEHCIYLEDRVILDYEIDDEDFEYFILRELKAQNLRIPASAEVEDFMKSHGVREGFQSKVTVRYVVEYFQWCYDHPINRIQ